MDYGKIRELIISKAKNSFEAAHAITSLDEIYEKDHHSKPTPRDEKNYYKDTNLETFYFDTKINVGVFGTIIEPAIMKAENDMIAK